MPSIKMIVVDIDGTLLSAPGTVVSRRNCRALRDAEAAGIEIVVATGRRQAYTMPLIEPVGLKPETVLITSNGTVMRTMAGQPIDRFLLPVETARGLSVRRSLLLTAKVLASWCSNPSKLWVDASRCGWKPIVPGSSKSGRWNERSIRVKRLCREWFAAASKKCAVLKSG
jgi:hypothetical protein